MTRKQERIYRTARRLLQNSTPLREDCGLLCDKACCKGDDCTGMLLFPGEPTPFRVIEQNCRRLAVCGGVCKREERPLSCMVFPFLPLPADDGRIRVRVDARGRGICPLARHAGEAAIRHRFLHRVRRVGALLLRDEETRAFLFALRREAEETEALLKRFEK